MKAHIGNVTAPDGTTIAYEVSGSGPALVLTNGVTTSTLFWKYLRARWREHFTVVTWDLPGHGQSGPPATWGGAGIEAQPAIIARIMDAVGIERAVQIGWSTGCQVVLEMYRQFPARCTALVALLGTAGHALDATRLPLLRPRILKTLTRYLPAPAFERVYGVIFGRGPNPVTPFAARALGLAGPRASVADIRAISEHLACVDRGAVQAMMASAQAHTAHDVLRGLEVPLLIVAGERDPYAPPERAAVPMHEAAPGSELLRLAEATHAGLVELPDEIGRAVEDFLARRVAVSGAA